MVHTPGEWTDGHPADAIVSQSDEGLIPYDSELHPTIEEKVFDYYGGYVIAESVAPCNKPLIKAAPGLLEACKQTRDTIGALSYGTIRDYTGYVEMIAELLRPLDDAIAKAEQ